MSYKIIPTKVHGILDYLVAVALFFAPMLFGFQDVGGMAVALPMILGVGLAAYSVLTKYEWGLIKVIPMSYHLVVDVVASLLLAASPFIFGFIDQSPNAWVPHIAVGVTVILVVILSQTSAPGDEPYKI